MHTSNQIKSNDFEIHMNGVKSSIDEVFPGFDPLDRVGVITRHVSGALGASALLMAAIARFYDFYRGSLGNKPGKLRIYPDFYIFHIGRRYTEHYWMDIWPPHKEVVVEDDPEQILEAINDRGITRLLVPDAPSMKIKSYYTIPGNLEIEPGTAVFLQETISSAKKRIKTCIAYSPTGRIENSNIEIKSSENTEKNVSFCLRDSNSLSVATRHELKLQREELQMDGRIVETYRTISLQEALSMLSASSGLSEATLNYLGDMKRSK